MEFHLKKRIECKIKMLHFQCKLIFETFTSGVRFGVQDPPMSAGPPDSRRALSSGLFASYSMGLASPLDIRARRKIIVRTDVEIIWAPIYRKDWTRATQWTDLSIRLPPFCGASRATGSSLGRRNLCPGRPPRKHCWTTKVSVCQFSNKQNHLKI